MRRRQERPPRRDWGEWYALAVRYRAEHGDLLVPKAYVCPDGEKLGRWIERQRAKYNRVPSMHCCIENWQIEALERIDMVWKLEYRRDWARWLEVLDRYKERHGHIDVPHSCVWEGFPLGDFIVKQRLYYAAGELTPQEIQDLEDRGIRWSLRTRTRSWDEWYADAEEYYRQHGDLRVTLDYRTSDGGKLGYWIYKQRDFYTGRKKGGALTPERIERLNAIGMVWEPLSARPDDWERMYRYVSDYRREKGKLPLWPLDLRAPDGRSPVGWIRTQRQQMADGKMPPERAQRLARLGITPPVRRAAPAQSP